LRHHICICKKKYGTALRVAMAIDAKPPEPFGYPTLLSQWVLFIQSGRYKNSRTAAASFVPHQYFSGTKINIIPETSKQFPKI